jgi:phosphatidylserine decarboxylase
MALKLEDWISTHVKNYKALDDGDIYYGKFFREENRPIIRDPNAFYSPADGVIIYQRKVRPDQKLVEVKGKNYTLHDLLMDDELKDIDYYVVGVFMTYYDVHVNRIPTDGLLQYRFLDSIQSNNLPMIFMEKGIFANDVNYKKNDYNYLFNNERMRNDIRYMKKGINYTVVQIADKDVDNITHFSVDNPDTFTQCERFSFIRWGSQCDLIIPAHPKYNFKFLQKEMYHVEAGIDKLVEIVEK